MKASTLVFVKNDDVENETEEKQSENTFQLNRSSKNHSVLS